MQGDAFFLNLVTLRQSTRAYRPDPVPRASIERCLEAARLAPSACNSQPWFFLVADTPIARQKLADAAFGGIYSAFKFAAAAPALIALVTERSRYAAAVAGWWRGEQYNLVDIGIAGEHFVLQAAAEGLGSCWIGWFNEKAVKHALALPRGSRVDILISLGYPADTASRPKSRKPLDAIRQYM